MAAYNQYSNLAHCIYPCLSGKELPAVPRIAALPRKGKEQPRLRSTVRAINGDSRYYQPTLLDSGTKPGPRNRWALAGAVVLQMTVLAVMVISSLFHTEELPRRETLTMLFAPPPAAASAGMMAPAPSPKSTYTPASSSIPSPVHKSQETPPPPPADTTGGVVGGIPGAMAGGVPGGVLGGVASSPRSATVLEKAPEPVNKRMRIASQVAEANLIHDVPPQYPPEAGRARIEGTVVLLAVIGKDGSVVDVRVKSGLPLLAQAAIDAVKQWRYRPYLMNGEPIEVDSQITIDFTLSRG